MTPNESNPQTGLPWTRRDFLKTMGAATASTLLLGDPSAAEAAEMREIEAKWRARAAAP